ncbi:MAG: hypothetical protein AAGA16_25780 [Cyanobacteria bacterium P01_E01_bin.35]
MSITQSLFLDRCWFLNVDCGVINTVIRHQLLVAGSQPVKMLAVLDPDQATLPMNYKLYLKREEAEKQRDNTS